MSKWVEESARKTVGGEAWAEHWKAKNSGYH